MENRLEQNEYAPYYQPYVDLVSEGDLITILSKQLTEMVDFLEDITNTYCKWGVALSKYT